MIASQNPPPDWDDDAADVAALFTRTAPDAPAWSRRRPSSRPNLPRTRSAFEGVS